MKGISGKLTVLLLTVISVLSLLSPASAAGGTYSDVPETAWFFTSVKTATELGIIEGMGGDIFAPDASLKLSEAIKMGSILHGMDDSNVADTDPWYRPYVEYAKNNGIIEPEDFPDLERPATRAEMAYIFFHSAGELTEINIIESLPDVRETDVYGREIFTLYRAGVLMGIDSQKTFKPEAKITRAEAATIIVRTAVTDRRITFNGHVIIIDPGHSAVWSNKDKEPIGPGATELKLKDTGGTYGKTSKTYEYVLNLDISLMLKTELEARGYTVFLTRETNDVALGNIDRAAFATEHGGEIMIRIHANGDTNTRTNGAMTICQTQKNPYRNLHAESRRLSDRLLESYCAATGIKKLYVWETDTMAGLNWSEIPCTIIEMGFMSNPTEDLKMANPNFRPKMVTGIADGIDAYFA